ncbi:MAG: hypothetical protein N2321_05840 [Melioribacteraceae bacterium]|nr:hypothetical protein [Melioribacteraceae bacterium]
MNFDGIISLLIACIELVYIINAFIFGKKNSINKFTIAILVLLFGYQFFEFLICFVGLQNQIIIYLAMVDITLLPPLGLYSSLLFAGKLKNYHKLIFIPAFFFIILYGFLIGELAVTKCTVLYASYHYPLGNLYATFYYLPIIGSMIILNKKWGFESDPKKKMLTRTYFFGFAFTFIPSMIFALFFPTFVQAVESLLCKMAFVLATFLFIFIIKNKE